MRSRGPDRTVRDIERSETALQGQSRHRPLGVRGKTISGLDQRHDMRNGQNNKRMRNRNNNNNSNNNNNNRRGQNPMTRVFESNGPDIKIRGTASHVAEKYVQLARDARSSGDPVAAENYYQHAEHYFRLIATAQEQFRQNQPQPRPDAEMISEDGDEDESFSNFGQEPGFVPVQQQPYQPRG